MKKLFVILGFLFVLGLCFIAQPAKSVVAAESHTITFDANGGSGEMAPVTVSTIRYELPECKFTAPQGKEFRCWKIYGDDADYAVGAKIRLDADKKLIAQWKAVDSGQGGEQQGGEQQGGEQQGGGSAPVTPAPSSGGEEKKGCGAKAVYIVGFGALALGAVIILKRKQF